MTFNKNVGFKLRLARKLIGLSQVEIANFCGIKQRDVSQLENNNRKFIPTIYILFLNKNGIDLGSLFDSSDEVRFVSNTSGNRAKMTANGFVPDLITFGSGDIENTNEQSSALMSINYLLRMSIEEKKPDLCKRTDCTFKQESGKQCFQISKKQCGIINLK